VSLVRETVPNVEFRVYGAATNESSEESRIQAPTAQIESHVVFCGVTAEPWSALREADVVMLPNVTESLPTMLIQAMLTGCAIVAVDAGGAREALASTGVLVPANRPAALAEAVALLLQSPHERRALGRQARQRALARFTEQRFIDAYRASYAKLLRRYPALPDEKPGDRFLDETEVSSRPELQEIAAAPDVAIA
jgi:glycosyltransferase involved in cell wall biosynthesis